MEDVYMVEYLDSDDHWKTIVLANGMFPAWRDRNEAEAIAKDYAETSRGTTGDIRERISAQAVAKAYRVVRYVFSEEVFDVIA